jgi:hypothetical protein
MAVFSKGLDSEGTSDDASFGFGQLPLENAASIAEMQTDWLSWTAEVWQPATNPAKKADTMTIAGLILSWRENGSLHRDTD